jgi:ribose transport system substrate-binding protein
MRTNRIALGSLALVLASAGVSACSSGGGSTTAAQGGTGAGCDLAAVNAKIDEAKKISAWAPPGPAFDAKKAAGKLVYTINEHSANEFGQAQLKGIKEAADKVGVKVVDYPNQGDKSQWIQGVSAAVNAKADAIVFIGGTIGPVYFQTQAEEARKAGVKLVTLIDTDITQPAERGTDARVGQRYAEAARLDADWIIADSKCKANTLVLTTNELIAGDINQKAAEDEFNKYCGSGCKITFKNIPLPKWTSQIQPTVQSAIQSDRKLNYVMPMYDAMVQFTRPAVSLAGANDRIKIASFNGTPAILGMIGSNSPVKMDVGENPAQLGYAAMDQTMRLLTGTSAVASGDQNVKLRIFDGSNVSEAGTPPALGVGYGDQWKSGYLKLWGLQ